MDKLNELKRRLNYKFTISDTVVDYSPMDVTRDKELKKKFKQISRAKVVVTDRLHGMIFCAFTNTPCIVLSNYNHKIKNSYETWLNHLDYIKFYDTIDVDKIIKDIEGLYSKKDFVKWSSLFDAYNPLFDELLN